MVWGEFGDWGCRVDDFKAGPLRHDITYAAQWLEVLERDYSHPCLVGWCPFNETHEPITDRISNLDDATRAMLLATRAMDSTRPVLDTSGYSHRAPEADIYDAHDYTQSPADLVEHHAGVGEGRPFRNGPADTPWSIGYRGQPFFVSEFGGTWWNPEAAESEASWGYGDRPRTLDEFYERFEALCGALLDNPHIFGYCYTQLTDIYQEQNGIYFFDRRAKFDAARLRAIQQRPAAIERRDS
jgi:hypothetical protein